MLWLRQYLTFGVEVNSDLYHSYDKNFDNMITINQTEETFVLRIFTMNIHLYSIVQVDFGALAMAKGLVSQGRHEAAEWVSTFTLSYSSVTSNFRFHEINSTVKVTTTCNSIRVQPFVSSKYSFLPTRHFHIGDCYL